MRVASGRWRWKQEQEYEYSWGGRQASQPTPAQEALWLPPWPPPRLPIASPWQQHQFQPLGTQGRAMSYPTGLGTLSSNVYRRSLAHALCPHQPRQSQGTQRTPHNPSDISTIVSSSWVSEMKAFLSQNSQKGSLLPRRPCYQSCASTPWAGGWTARAAATEHRRAKEGSQP